MAYELLSQSRKLNKRVKIFLKKKISGGMLIRNPKVMKAAKFL